MTEWTSASESARPYVMAVSSHRGGTGRTTLCAGLAWHWTQQGYQVTLVDANPVAALKLLICPPDSHQTWPGVNLVAAPHGLQSVPELGDIVLIDAPPLTEPLCQQSLSHSQSLLLCSGSDPFSLLSMPQATTRLKDWLIQQQRLELLGIAVPIHDSRNPHQMRGLARLGEFENVLLEPAIPARPEFRDWPLNPGTPPPRGPANDALEVLSFALLDLIRERSEVRAGSVDTKD